MPLLSEGVGYYIGAAVASLLLLLLLTALCGMIPGTWYLILTACKNELCDGA